MRTGYSSRRRLHATIVAGINPARATPTTTWTLSLSNKYFGQTICLSFLAQRLRLEKGSDLRPSRPHAASYWMAHAATWPVSGYAPEQPLRSAFLVPKILSSYLAQLSFFDALALPGHPDCLGPQST